MTRFLGPLLGVLLGGCAGSSGGSPEGAPPVAPETPASATPAPAASAATAPGAPAGAKPPAGVPPAAAPSPEVTAPVVTFPPRDFAPPFAKTAAEGDGRWTPLGEPGRDRAASFAPPVLLRAVVHPHPASRYVTVTLAAVDLSRVAVRLTPGTEDLDWAKIERTADSGLVPSGARGALLAVMNGGFQPKHGRWGMMAEGVTVAPAREEGCTLALYDDDAVRLAPWSDLSPTREHMRSFRQTPPCLLVAGLVHPALIAGRDKAWAGHATDLTTRRRSAVGLDATGGILFYAVGEEADPRWLAEGLRSAGAASAAELDINWYWTRFLTFGAPEDGTLRVTSTLIPRMEHLPTGYVERRSTRDFFYLLAKPLR